MKSIVPLHTDLVCGRQYVPREDIWKVHRGQICSTVLILKTARFKKEFSTKVCQQCASETCFANTYYLKIANPNHLMVRSGNVTSTNRITDLYRPAANRTSTFQEGLIFLNWWNHLVNAFTKRGSFSGTVWACVRL